MTVSEGHPVFPLPLTIDAIDCEWLTAALRVNAPGVTVRHIEVVNIINATSTCIRLKLDMDEAGKRAGIPETVFFKGGFPEHSRELAFMHKIETLGYRDLLPDGELNTPKCYFADWDEESLQGIVVMEDLQRRGGSLAIFG